MYLFALCINASTEAEAVRAAPGSSGTRCTLPCAPPAPSTLVRRSAGTLTHMASDDSTHSLERARRLLIVRTCAALARLQSRVIDERFSYAMPGESAPGQTRTTWPVSSLSPPSPWLAGVRDTLSLDYILTAISRAQAQLLDAVASSQPLDALSVCLTLQSIAVEANAWTPPVQKLAVQWGVELPPSPPARGR